jgi:LuxR family maltose regulon positive regulatory protein
LVAPAPILVASGHGFQPAFRITRAKLHPIGRMTGEVPRTRLLETLDVTPAPNVISIVAPAGYGKTTAVRQWATRTGRSVAWLNIDHGDNDPVVLLTYVAAALDTLGPLGDALAPALAGPSEHVLATALPRLASAVHEWRVPVVLVIDDAHRLVDPAAVDALSSLLDLMPDDFTAALAGRREPALPLARHRIRRTLLEIGPAQLELDEGETAALARATGWDLDPDAAAELAATTDGWAAAVYLASLGHVRDVAERRTTPGSGERYIAEYLQTEVRDRLAPEDVALLTRTSVLELIEPPVADAVAGVTGSGPRLAALAADNLLIQPMGGPAGGYRCHRLLRTFLQAELDRREPGRRPVYHRRAARWFIAADASDRAVDHLIAAGDMDAAARLLAAIGLGLFRRGAAATVNRLFARLGPNASMRTPSLAVNAAWLALLAGHAEEALAMARRAEAADRDSPSHSGAANLASELRMLRVVMGTGRPAELLEDARLAVETEPAGSPWHPQALWLLGAAYRLNGDLDAADRAWAASSQALPLSPPSRMASMAARAAIAMRRGDWASARRLIETMDSKRVDALFEGYVMSLIAAAVEARLAVHEGDPETARHHLVRAQLLRPLANHGMPWFSVDALLELTRAYLALGDLAGARQTLREAEQIARLRPELGAVGEDLEQLRQQLAGAVSTLAGSSALTTAELRILLLLPTYLSFQQIADRLHIARNTVKTHVMAIYGKLWATSRAEAVTRAVELGLLEPYPFQVERHPGDEPHELA